MKKKNDRTIIPILISNKEWERKEGEESIFEERGGFFLFSTVLANRNGKRKKKKWEKKRKLGSVLVREERSCRGERCAVGRVAFVNFVDKTRRVLTARREAPGARPRERAPR